MIVYSFPTLYEEIVKARINRFTVVTESEKICHLHDPGRLKELIYPGNKILIRNVNGKRKTNCQVTAAWSGKEWVVTDSSIHNEIARRFLPSDAKSEVTVGKSRIDFAFDNTYVEVKGCTLARDGIALFPDAPTKRGKRHLDELIELRRNGYSVLLMILVFRTDVVCFSPNFDTDRDFSNTFIKALKEGVNVEVKVFQLDKENIVYKGEIPVCHQILEKSTNFSLP
ncbi:DNA/RNA nuclease SfsA [Sulfurisphaera tokodaii]|uniref:Sugar fermentation stimulation protein homolog n=2 Tax=Sulfurisphaera tokodaii TaxID=111955 RepID=SFSA_SULTO|nr:DNA/RNA nuclease SfsA [Sulfurisphaera tokodaii]P58432.1 RecName: Full=Sugar fermentation stimulation protein homolog [Sulfurisphaera tokodaii str. 7]BAB66083.1 sugar fermentation stimulation protein homolog [Sulfurisphaera tokodaii str. 7]HII75434.1 DNA/RNA nuclease SfsA [Sulfurisphaera tokodaii]